MAKQTLNNGENQLSFRTKLNDMFTEVYNSITSIGSTLSSIVSTNSMIQGTLSDHSVALDVNSSAHVAFDLRLDTLEMVGADLVGKVQALENTGVLSVGALGALAVQSITTTYEKLTYFTSVVFESSYSVAAENIVDQETTITYNGVYKIYGDITFYAPSNSAIFIQMFINGVAHPGEYQVQGLGTGKPVTITAHPIVPLIANDVVTFNVKADSSINITVVSSSITFEKTRF